MRKITDTAAQKRRKKDALQSALVASVWTILSACLILALRWYYQIGGLGGAVLLIVPMLELGMLIPVWILLKIRWKEIEGGEEDAAAQY